MALVVEDGTGMATAESYISVADADAYHTARGHAAWAELSDAEKESALRDATVYLDGQHFSRFCGVRANEAQALAWPRLGRDADGYLLNSGSVPDRIAQATAELALRRSTDELAADAARGGSIVEVSAGSGVGVRYAEGAPIGTVYREVNLMIRRFLRGGRKVVR